MNNSKRLSVISTRIFRLFVGASVTLLFVIGMNALMTKMELRWAAQEQEMAELCTYKPDVQRPLVCTKWDAQRKASRATPPQG
jgi:hypothetical protein